MLSRRCRRARPQQLLELPESGIGYQRVDVRFASGRELKSMLVCNAENLDVPDDLADVEIRDLRPHAA